MLLGSWLLVITSAVLYPLSFIFSEHLWWLAFVFPIPLLYVAVKENISFATGYVWGALTIALHMWGVFYAVYFMAEGFWLIKLLPAFVVIFLHTSVLAGCLFLLAHLTITYFKIKSYAYRLIVWASTLWVFFLIMDRWCLLPFDYCEGYFLVNPLLPLAQNPPMLFLLPYLGKLLLMILFLCVPATFVYLLISRSLRSVTLLIAALLPWVLPFCMTHEQLQKPVWLEKIVALPAVIHKSSNLTAMAANACTLFKEVIEQNPKIELIVMPESSYYCDALASFPELSKKWNSASLGKPVSVLVGAFRWKDGKFFNSLHWFFDGTLQACFDKRHSMLLTERVPSLVDVPLVRNQFFSKLPEICPSLNKREPFSLLKEKSFVPYICSELFFNQYPDDNFPNETILAVCNDRYFYTPVRPYVQNLMALEAIFKAIEWQRDIIYISFSQALYINRTGQKSPLELAFLP